MNLTDALLESLRGRMVTLRLRPHWYLTGRLCGFDDRVVRLGPESLIPGTSYEKMNTEKARDLVLAVVQVDGQPVASA